MANLIGEDEAASLLEETLNEEKETDSKLTELAEDINVAAEGESDEEATEEEAPRRSSSSSSNRKRKRAA
jgi:hypothetical protein